MTNPLRHSSGAAQPVRLVRLVRLVRNVYSQSRSNCAIPSCPAASASSSAVSPSESYGKSVKVELREGDFGAKVYSPLKGEV